MSIEPAQLASSLGALGSLDVDQHLDVTLPQVLGSARTLLDADRAGLMLLDQAGVLRWASGSDRMGEAVVGDLSVPVEVGGGPVGTLDVYVTARKGMDAPAALEWLATAARPSGSTLVQMARAVVGGAPLPSDRLAQAKAWRREATDREVAVHRRDSELHEDAARGYERHGQPGRAQTERLQAAAARGRIIDAEAEQRRADRAP
jgi:hypothetical protein